MLIAIEITETVTTRYFAEVADLEQAKGKVKSLRWANTLEDESALQRHFGENYGCPCGGVESTDTEITLHIPSSTKREANLIEAVNCDWDDWDMTKVEV